MKNLFTKSLITLSFITGASIAQNNQRLLEMAQETAYDKNQAHFVKLKEHYTIYENSVEAFLNSVVFTKNSLKVKKSRSMTDDIGYSHSRYDILFNNIPVHNAVIVTHALGGKITSINGDLSSIPDPVNSIAISEKKAFLFALEKVNAKKYKWENKVEENHMRVLLNDPNFTYSPKGKVIMYNKAGKIYYAYLFNIYAEEPLYKANVIVDASTGAILEEENQICTVDVPATANTKYSGVKSFTVDNVSAGLYRLQETGRGNGIKTFNMNNGTNYAAATDFTNTSTSWTTTGVDQAATDAHWGAEMTYDYYKLNHNRNSIDGAGYNLLSYVHYNTNYNNAFWDGTRMTYGDGSGSYTIFTGLDVCGHEITHGLTSNTSNLTYSNESGALNESYSDIFGNSIENYGRPTQWSWKIGEDITVGGGGLRNMSNPNAFADPDTYNGTNWYTGTADNGGVHTNSGVSNFWYYLLVTGGTGTNDISNSYTVSSIGWTAASRIAFRALTVYYTPSTNYATARNLSIQAAKDLYGNCSNEVVQVTNAWYAVGVGPAYSNSIIPNFAATSTAFCSVPATINFNNTTANGLAYTWDFGDGSSVSTATNPAHTYTANGTYSVKLKATGCLSVVDSITKTSYITISTPANPVTVGALRCGAGTLTLTSTGGSQLYWYATPTATGTPINIGGTYSTPSLTTTTTYYVVNTSTNTPVFGAPTNTSIGAGANFNTATAYEIFDVYQPCTLLTTVMYASTAGNRTVELRNSANAVITSTVVNLAIGTNTVALNFALTPGTGYRLGLNSASAVNLYRNSAGAVYPYNVGGLVSITNSSAGTPGYYYFFYNWQVQKAACTSAAIPVTATISPGPALSVNSATICNGQTANLIATGATTYSWSSGQTTGNINVTPAATTNYTIYGTSSACTNSLTTSVVVNPNPTVTVNSATICSGQNAVLTANGATAYSWSSGPTTSSISVNPTSTTTYTVIGLNGTCTGAALASVMVNPTPIVSVNSSTICAGNSALLTASGATSYSWSSGQSTSNIVVSPTTTTSYTVTGTSGTCSNTKVTNVNVNALPSVSLAASSTTACTASTGGITVNLSGTPSGGVYSGTGVSGTTFTVQATAGTYPVAYSYTDAVTGCSNSNTTNITVNVCTGITVTGNLVYGLSVYPNPVTDYLLIKNNSEFETLVVNIYDVTGKVVLTQTTSESSTSIIVEQFAKGLYFVEILNNSTRVYKTNIIKQ